MANWFEQMQEQVNRENEAALTTKFHRLVDEGVFPNTPETRAAFVKGWFGTVAYKADKRDLDQAGSDFRALAIMCYILGALLVSLPVVVFFNVPAGELVSDRLLPMIGIGLVLLLIGYLFSRKERKVYGNAVAAHRAKWGNPDEKESVDE